MKLVCDASPERLSHMRTLYPGIETTQQFETVLNGAGIDIVAIATPIRTHYNLAKQAILAGKHTFVEKPLASSPEECEELIELAQRQGCRNILLHALLDGRDTPPRCAEASLRRFTELFAANGCGAEPSSRRYTTGAHSQWLAPALQSTSTQTGLDQAISSSFWMTRKPSRSKRRTEGLKVSK